MSRFIAVNGIQSFLRSHAKITALHGYTSKCVAIRANNDPPPFATHWAITITEGGDDAGNEQNYELSETHHIETGIWRRANYYAQDRVAHQAMKVSDTYNAALATLHDIERAVKAALQWNYTLVDDINTAYSLPDATGADGDQFTTPLVYRGSSRMETKVIPHTTGEDAWTGYVLRWFGLMRVQRIGGIG